MRALIQNLVLFGVISMNGGWVKGEQCIKRGKKERKWNEKIFSIHYDYFRNVIYKASKNAAWPCEEQ